ncbi:hypothetical protein DTO169C6_8208 [Paecilomyces variotii]|nr:hypothetical protein DTO169C6_8208 [Paecilomyces variotii]KAJ9351169.1 hypothetical protein DTO027B9_6569 [Paecilomyces variotii]
MSTPALPTTYLSRNDSTLYEDVEYSSSDLTITEATTCPNTPSFLLRTSSTFGVVDGSAQSSQATLSSTDALTQESVSQRESMSSNRRSTYPGETTSSGFLSPVPSLEDIEKCCTRSMTSVASDSDTEMGFTDNDEPRPERTLGSPPFLMEPHYLNYIRLLSLDLPHLAYSPIRPQHDIMSLTVLDFSTRSSCCRTRFFNHGSASALSETEISNITQVLQDSARPTGSDIMTSVIIAEDLSCEVMELLGSTFELHPEFFETHLINSRYARPSPKQIPVPQPIWPTASLPKDFQSVKWFRPVWRSPGAGSQRLWDSYHRQPFHGLIASSPRRNKTSRGLVYFANNIIRFGWNLAAEPQELPQENKEDSSMGTTAIPVAWEERATFCMKTIGNRRCIVLLLDPLPMVKEKLTRNESDPAAEHHGDIDSERRSQENHDYAVFRDMYLRGLSEIPLQQVDINNCSKVRQQLRESVSTSFYLRQRCGTRHRHSSNSTPNDPLEILNELICHDSLNLLRVINGTLDRIQSSLSDSHLTETQLCHWHEFIRRCEANIPTLRTTLSSLSREYQDTTVEPPLRSTVRLSQEALEVTAATSARLQEVSASLVSNISLLGTRQDIAKKKSISRLSELAFFFLPIIVSASIFGMRVRELNHPPIWAFFTLSIILMLLSYGLRWMMAIDIWKRWKEFYPTQSQHEICRYRDDVLSESTARRSVMRWTMKRRRLPSYTMSGMFSPQIMLREASGRPISLNVADYDISNSAHR